MGLHPGDPVFPMKPAQFVLAASPGSCAGDIPALRAGWVCCHLGSSLSSHTGMLGTQDDPPTGTCDTSWIPKEPGSGCHCV